MDDRACARRRRASAARGATAPDVRAAIRRRYEDLFQNFAPQVDGRIDEICADGDLAFVRGHNGGWLVSRVGRRSRELDDFYLMVLQRVPRGEWKISRLMWHPAHGPAG